MLKTATVSAELSQLFIVKAKTFHTHCIHTTTLNQKKLAVRKTQIKLESCDFEIFFNTKYFMCFIFVNIHMSFRPATPSKKVGTGAIYNLQYSSFLKKFFFNNKNNEKHNK